MITHYEALLPYFKAYDKSKEIYSKVGKVVSVDETARTILFEPLEGAETPDVRLQASINSSVGFVQIPSVDSFVIITYLDESRGYVAMCTEIDKILIDTDLVQFNGGDNGGLAIIEALTTKINGLVEEVAALKPYINTHTHPTPAGASSAPTTLFTGSFTDLDKDDYENTNITH